MPTATDYSTMNGVAIRNALTTETDLPTLLRFAADPRTIVADKAKSRIRQLGAPAQEAPAPGAMGGSVPALKPGQTAAGAAELAAIQAESETAPEPKGGRPLHRPAAVVQTERRQNVPKPAAAPSPKPAAAPSPYRFSHLPQPHGYTDDTIKVCTACGAKGPIGTLFGWRKVMQRGKLVKITQPQCRACRNKASQRSAKRVR